MRGAWWRYEATWERVGAGMSREAGGEVGGAMLSLGGPKWQNAVLGRDALKWAGSTIVLTK